MAKYDIVIGSNFGDESKGTIVARIAKEHKDEKVLNVLTNGGSQRGHSVLTEKGQHVFKHFGSGTPFGAKTCFAESFILNPMQYIKEKQEIENTFGIKVPRAARHPLCKWSTPFDMMVNQIESQTNWTGTCGMGIWTTICRYNDPTFNNITFSEFNTFEHEQKVMFLTNVRSYWEKSGKLENKAFSLYKDAWYSQDLIEHFIKDCFEMFFDTSDSLWDYSPKGQYDHVIYENGQGLLLSDNGIDDKEKTPSFTGMNIFKSMPTSSSWFRPTDNFNIHYVTRPYITRHGSNVFEDKKIDCNLNKSTEINQFNDWQHELKYSNLDIKNLKQRVYQDASTFDGTHVNNIILDVTHCDEFDREREFRKMFHTCNFYDSAKV